MTGPPLPGEATLVASWRALARRSAGATVDEPPTSVAAVFPAWAPLNNAIARVPADDADATAAEVARLAADTRAAGVDDVGVLDPEPGRDLTTPDRAPVAGLTRDATTLVMRRRPRSRARATRRSRAPPRSRPRRWRATSRWRSGRSTRPSRSRELQALGDGARRARDRGLWTCVHDGDCGIYAMGTAPRWRRQGVARALVEHTLAVAREQGARTASLQSTPMAVSLYRSLGFEAVGRYEEWVCGAEQSSSWSNQTRSSSGMPSTSSPSG